MSSTRAVRSVPLLRVAAITLAGLLAVVPFALHAAEEYKLTAEQTAALESTRKGFGKAKKLQVEIERMMGQAAETNRVQLALKLAVVVAEKWPDDAADAVGKLVQLLPAQAVPLVHAALKAAPKQARPIASAAMTASPTNSILITSTAIQVVPAEGNAILEAASWRVPQELKPQLEQLKARLPPEVVKPPAKPVKVENPFSK
ncbi:MAG: hypothetical protein ACKODH_15125 [Limisphaerales bacterium]